MYLVDLADVVSRASSLEGALDATSGIWESIYDRMRDDETLWVVAPNDYRDGHMWPIAMAVAEYAREESALTLKNSISVHTWNDRGGDMEDAVVEILFFVKDKRKYQFHKDAIRTAHVYKGHEWGGERESGQSAYHDADVARYNPNGKDPGNVWINEDRTQTAGREVDETGPLSLDEAVRRCVLAGSTEGESVYLVDVRDEITAVVSAENRVPNRLTIADVCREVST